MRKVLYIAVAACGLFACTRKEIIVSEPCNFTVTLEEVRGTKVKAKVVPQNRDAAYVLSVISSYDPSFDNTPEALAADQVSIMKEVYSREREAGNFSDQFCFRGERTLKYQGLVSDTDHKLLLLQINPKEQSMVGKPLVVPFHTLPVERDTDLTFDVRFQDGKMTIVPSDPDKTFYWEYDNTRVIEDEFIAPGVFLYKVINLYEDYDFMLHLLDKGTQEWDFYAQDNEIQDDEDLTVMIVGYDNGEMTTEVTSVRFICHRDGPIEVLEND